MMPQLSIDRYARVGPSGYVGLTNNQAVRTFGTGRLFGRLAAKLSGPSENAKVKADFKESLVQRYGDGVMRRNESRLAIGGP